MRTTGYKRQRAEFQDLLYELVRRVGTQTSEQGNILPAGIELGSGVKTVGTPRLMTQGAIAQTGKETDIAVRGEGFLPITLPDGRTAYTRDGSLAIDATGRLVTAQGNLLNPAITIPANSTGLTINAQGQVLVTPAGTTTSTQVGQIQLALFINKSGLQGIGDNLFLETPSSGTAQLGTPGALGFGNLLQNSLEQANVEAVSEISDLIAAQRAYEMNAKVVTAADQMLQSTSGMMR
jgi:flagellar basal-body rod protein FlgG